MPIQNLDPRAAHEAMAKDKGHVFVDVRTPDEYDAGHPAGAVNVPWALVDPRTGQMAHNAAFLSTISKHFPPATKVYASCLSGVRSMNACRELESAGFQQLVNVDGGFGGKRDPTGRATAPGWRDSGLPIETSRSTYATLKA